MCISVELCNAVDYAEKINVYNEGEISVFNAGIKPYEEIIIGWKSMIDGAHEMPAFGVSLDRETRKVIKNGVWVEFVFDEPYESNGMPYEKLLIKVEKNSQGFNIIRYSSKYGYDGRCFYYDLVGRDMSNFYDILLNL